MKIQKFIACGTKYFLKGVGNALLNMLARQQGFEMGDLVTNLSRDAANAVKDLNRFGFEQSAQIEQFRSSEKRALRSELLDSGDIEAYARSSAYAKQIAALFLNAYVMYSHR